MRLKTFIAGISLLSATFFPGAEAFGCGPFEFQPYSYTPFCVIEPLTDPGTTGTAKAEEETMSFWKEYLKGSVSEDDIRLYFDHATFSDPRPSEGAAFYRKLESNRDETAISYVLDCLEFSALIIDFNNSGWEYTERNPANLNEFAAKIEHRKGGKFFSPRYDLLRMRVAGFLHDDETVMQIWEKKGKKMKPSLLRDRMGGFVGGVLYRQAKYPEALDYFYQSGDSNSIAWCVSKIVGPDNLRALYEHNPNSTATLYALTDYLNYLISNSNAGRRTGSNEDGDMDEDILNALRQRKDFIDLCDRGVSENKCENPMAWAIAKGAIELTMGDAAKGLSTLDSAHTLKGNDRTEMVLDHFRLWALLLNSGKGNSALDSRFTSELDRIYATAAKEAMKRIEELACSSDESFDYYEYNSNDSYLFLITFFAQEARTHYMNLGQPARGLAILGMMEELPIAPINGSGMFQTDMREYIFRTLSDREAMSFISLAQGEAGNSLDRYLSRYAAKFLNLANEAYGTRLLCKKDFRGAREYFMKVDIKWIPTLAIYPYLNRYYAPYSYSFSRRETGDGRWSPYYPSNVKARFCTDMINYMEAYEKASGNDRAEVAFNIAANYHQASPQGDAWAISDYAWSVDQPLNSFNEESMKWLKKALADATDPKLQCKIYYGILSSPVPDPTEGVKFAIGQTGGYDSPVKYYWNNRTELNQRAMDYIVSNYYYVENEYTISQCDVLRDYAAARFVPKPRHTW